MKKVILAAVLVSSPLIAYGAKEDTKIDFSKIDNNKFCVYENKIYSIGAVIEESNRNMECGYTSTNYNGIPPGAYWSRASK